MTFRHPFQKLCAVPSQQKDRQFLLAASGSTVNCICFHQKKLLSQWPTQRDEDDAQSVGHGDNGDVPNKRRKIDADGRESVSRQQSEASEASLEIVSERRKGERKKSKFIDTRPSTVSHLLATSDGRHAIVVTAEDKMLRVFEIALSGTLKQLSERALPKKLCAVELTKDEQTVLAADKFGDVYAIPLHPSKDWVPKQRSQEEKKFKPSASELTIHTRKNRVALRQQMEQKNTDPRKEGPQFEHQVVLGHVSLLTDLLAAEAEVDGKSRPFIITADRDEHIRVSRGMPQAHVIENYCLGNKEFVTKLCIPPAAPHLLISGSGVPSLATHSWRSGELKSEIGSFGIRVAGALVDLSDQPTSLEDLPEGRKMSKLAVSGIWPIEFSRTINPKGEEHSLVMVAVEGIPTLFSLALSEDRLTFNGKINLPGNVLDVTPAPNGEPQLLVSIDNVHRSCSMKDYRNPSDLQPSSLHLFELSIRTTYVEVVHKFEWKEVDLPFDMASVTKSLPTVAQLSLEDNVKTGSYEKILSPLGELLYGLENLRKKRGSMAEEGAAEEAVEEEVDEEHDPTLSHSIEA